MNDTDATIRDLIDRVRSGNQDALGELLNRYRNHLHEIARQQLIGRAAARLDASDMVQQTCLSVHRKIAEFDGGDPAQFAAWLRQIHERNITNALRDQLQTQKRAQGREEQLSDGEELLARQTSPSGQAMRKEDTTRLARVLAQLPDDERQALQLRYFEGRTLAEICAEMGLTRDALVWLMSRAMKTMKSHLSENPD